MKKNLLLAGMLLSGALCAFAADLAEYAPVDGYVFKPLWLNALNADEAGQAAWKALPIAGPNYARTSAIAGDKVYIASTKTNAPDGSLVDESSLIELDLLTGEYLRTIQLTHADGSAFSGLLAANCITSDEFGHIIVGGCIASMYAAANPDKGVEAHPNPLNLYVVDPSTGVCTLTASLTLPVEESEASGRLDYYDIIGDITGKEAPSVVVAPLSGTSAVSPVVLGWRLEQGESEWKKFMGGGDYVSLYVEETFPAEITTWGGAPAATIVKDEDYTGEFFYIDAFVTPPTLYATSGSMVESFAEVPELSPKVGTNGCAEFNIKGVPFLAYSIEQYDSGCTCRARIVRLGEGSVFAGMKEMYTFPEGGLGSTSDGGARFHTMRTLSVTDDAGKAGVYVLTHKGANGIGAYLFAEEGFDSAGVEPDVLVPAADAPVEYFDLRGVRVDKPQGGLFIRRCGGKVAKLLL